MNLSKQLGAISMIASRDFLKFLHDRPRIIATFIFPLVFVGILGKSFESSLGPTLPFNFLLFTFTGVLANTVFQSSASGVISLIADRETDFSQEMFVSPISRYAIVVGKIFGESLVALTQAVGVIIFGFILGVPISLGQVISTLPALVLICLLGGAFGVLVLANLSNQRSANQIFPFVIFPQFFLAGIFNPLQNLPWYLDILSKIAPLTYAVDLMRGLVYRGTQEAQYVVVRPIWMNLLIIAVMFAGFLVLGTWLFVRNEKNR